MDYEKFGLAKKVNNLLNNIKENVKLALKQGGYGAAFTTLVGGTAFAQISLVLASPLLSRIYTPEEFGIFGILISWITVLSISTSMRYELAISLPEDTTEADNLTALCIMILVIYTIFMATSVALFEESFEQFYKNTKVTNYLWIIAPGVFMTGAYSIFSYYIIRLKKFEIIASTKVKQTYVTILIQIISYKLNGLGLIMGQIIGQAFGLMNIEREVSIKKILSRISWEEVKTAAIRYKRFPIFSLPAGLIKTTGEQLPTITLAAFYGASSAGYYYLAHAIITKPLNIIASAVHQVFYRASIDYYRDNKLAEFVDNTFINMSKLIMPIFYTFYIHGESIFVNIFGYEWRDAGVVSEYIVLWILLQMSVGSIMTVFFTIEKQEVGLLLQAIMFTLRVSALSYGFYYLEFIETVMLFAMTSAVAYVINLFVILNVVNAKIKDIMLRFLKNLGITGIIIMPTVPSIGINIWISGAIALILYIIYYYDMLNKLTKENFINEF